MIYSPTQLANHLKLIRQKKRWTQSELANRVGLKQATLSHFENNPDLTTLATLFKIIQSLDLAMEIQDKNSSPSTTGSDREADW